ncbi:hypothetical protein C4K68_06950 [Pokkaliibacter plantistimulans]|uniref:Chemotaxis protein n=1 Tax=Proteobacteria bacterium 228 TaxID=2083153 RepID=A0A2S5KTU2_9PROT|nr:methyl-accepting chemotaxis protein [Pokkaliibacter plantistimulans]PPC78133.1 hypothetical protein C4K68_06950 [Pokkaliibacter plantistimulans]
MRLKLLHKLLLLILPAALCLLIFAAQLITIHIDQSGKASQVYNEIALTTVNSRLVHELQKERGMSAGFLGSKGQTFGSELKQQRLLTDQRVSELHAYLTNNADVTQASEVLRQTMQDVQSQLARLEQIRQQVDAQSLKVPDAVGFYTRLNHDLIATIVDASKHAPSVALSQGLQTYYSLIQMKELAGLERAALSNGFGAGAMSDLAYANFLRLLSGEQIYADDFRNSATTAQAGQLDALLRQPAMQEVESFRQHALQREFSQDAKAWFQAATVRINQLKTFEDELAEGLMTSSSLYRSSASQGLWLVLSLTALSLLLVIGLGIWIIRGLRQQIEHIGICINHIVTEHDLTSHAKVITFDELGVIARQLSELIDMFRQSIHQIVMSSEQVSHSSHQTSETVSNTQQHLNLQKQEAFTVSSAIEQMAATVKEVSENAVATSDHTGFADRMVQASISLNDQVIEAVTRAVNQINSAVGSIQGLNNRSNQIANIIDVIKGIAEQTNLLALNAAIEAARAGEQGRGFAVVADEVRSLAQRTQISTGEIESMIQGFQADSNKAVTDVEVSKRLVDDSMARTGEVSNNLTELRRKMTDISDRSLQIAAATEQQATVSEQIARSMLAVRESTDKTAMEGQIISQAAEELSQLAAQLKGMAGRFVT